MDIESYLGRGIGVVDGRKREKEKKGRGERRRGEEKERYRRTAGERERERERSLSAKGTGYHLLYRQEQGMTCSAKVCLNTNTYRYLIFDKEFRIAH